MKIKSLSDLSGLYSSIASVEHNIPPTVNENTTAAVAYTDTSRYLTENMVKAGSPLGNGPKEAIKKMDGIEVNPLLKNSGPAGLMPKKSGFKPVDKVEDPGSDDKVMKREEEGKEEESDDSSEEKETAKNTTPEEKIQESVVENNKYNYKPKFTMSKSKFDNLYEAALKGVPFNENEESMHPMQDEDEAGVMPATDAAADGEHEMGGEHEEESHLSHEEAIEAVEKLLKFLKKDMETDKEQGTLDHEDEEQGAEGEEGMMAEEVEAEDEGHVLTKANGSLKKGNPDAVNKPVVTSTKGTNKATGGKAVDGKIRNEPEPKEVEGDESAMHGNKNKLQNTKKFTAGATKEPKVGDDLFA
jgi:hypothetical protein